MHGGTMNGLTVFGNAVALLINLAYFGVPVIVVMALDRYKKQWRGWKYYLTVYVILLVLGLLGSLLFRHGRR